MRRSAWAHLALLAYMWEVTEAGVMKAYLRPEDRALCVCGGGESRVPGFLAKAKHQADNYSESELLASSSFHCFPLLYRISSPCPHLSSLKQERRAGLSISVSSLWGSEGKQPVANKCEQFGDLKHSGFLTQCHNLLRSVRRSKFYPKIRPKSYMSDSTGLS